MKHCAHTITITATLVAMTMAILFGAAGPSMSATAATSVGTFAGTLGGRRAGAAPLVQAGMRLTFWAGTSAVAGAQGPLQPDANGNWQDPATGKRYAQGASASMGYQQVNIEDVVDGRAIVDVRHYLVDAATNAVTNYKTEGYEFSPQSGGDYWISPKQLASMVETGTGTTVHRLAYPLNGHAYNAIRITTKAIPGATTGGTQRTYDLDTGVLLSYGSSYMAPGTRSDGNGGVVDSGSTPYLVQIFLVGMRLTTLPWIGERAGPEVQAQRRATFSGTYTTTFEGVPPTTARLTQQWDISKADESTLRGLIYYLKLPEDKNQLELRFRNVLEESSKRKKTKKEGKALTYSELKEKLNDELNLFKDNKLLQNNRLLSKKTEIKETEQ